ncbi:MAG: hypothetical protein IH851_04480 [Armatimonadetes bacterium]|nr:hypothetical protein [Armatimonadota bacterium]
MFGNRFTRLGLVGLFALALGSSAFAHRFIVIQPMNSNAGFGFGQRQYPGGYAYQNPFLYGPFISPFVIIQPSMHTSEVGLPLHFSDRYTMRGGYSIGLNPSGFYFADPRSIEYSGPFTHQHQQGVPIHFSDRYTRRGGYYFGLDPWGFYFVQPQPRFRERESHHGGG